METTTDDQVNAELARKIGWTVNEFDEWDNPAGKPERADPPAYLSDPAASAELEDWLHAKGWRTEVVITRISARVIVYASGGEEECIEGITSAQSASAARRRALALAAWEALCAPDRRPR